MRIARLAFAAVTAVTLMAAPQAARAQDCDRLVVDDAGVLGSGFSRVQDAANSLMATGADVRVRTVRDFAGRPTLDDYADDLQASCPTWRAADGGFKRNLIVLMASFGDRKAVGLYYGEDWISKLDDGWPGIKAASVVPSLQKEDPVGAFVGGLTAITSAVKPAEKPFAGTAAPTNAPPPSGGGVSSGVWILIALVVGGTLVVVLVAWLLISRSKRKKARSAAQRAAKAARDACVVEVNGIEHPFVMAGSMVSTAAQGVSDEDVAPLRVTLAKAQRTKDEAMGAFAKLEGADNDPDREHETETYRDIEAKYSGIEAKFKQVRTLIAEVEQGAAATKRTTAAAPMAVEAADMAYRTAQAEIDRVSAEGYRTAAAEKKLGETAKAALGRARSALEEKRFGAAKSEADAAHKAADEAKAIAAGLPARKDAIGDGISDLRHRIKAIDVSFDEGEAAVKRLEANFAATCWESIQGNGKEAEECLERATASVDEALEAGTMEAQSWDQADAALNEARRECERAESLMRSVHALEKSLETARRDAPKEIADADADVKKTRDYIKLYDPDIDDGIYKDVDRAERDVAEAKAELDGHRPDVLDAIKKAKRANALADELLGQARSQHEAAERARQKAASDLRDADAATSKASEYLEDHGSEVSARTAMTLREAYEHLGEAGKATDPGRISALAGKAMAAANATYKTAKAEVDERKRQRDLAQAEAARQSRVVIPMPSVSQPSPPRPAPRAPSVPSPSRRGGGSEPVAQSRRGGGSSAW